MDETHFELVYGTKVILPTEAGLPTITTLVVENVEENQRQLAKNLDILEEVCECAHIRRAAYQHKARAFYERKKMKIRRFIKGEWVMRRIPEVMQMKILTNNGKDHMKSKKYWANELTS